MGVAGAGAMHGRLHDVHVAVQSSCAAVWDLFIALKYLPRLRGAQACHP